MKKSILILLLFVVAQCLGAALVIVAVRWAEISDGMPPDVALADAPPRAYAVGLGAAYALLLAVLWATRLVRRCRPSAPRQRYAHWPLVVGATLCLALGQSLLLGPLGLEDGGMTDRFAAMRADAACVVLLVLIGPLAEEVVFRAGILRALLDGGSRPAVAIGTSALCFAAVHGNVAQAVPAFVTGAVLGWLYVRTGDIRLCTVAHVCNNALALALLGLPEAEALGLPSAPAAGVAAGLALVAAGLGGLWAWQRRDTACARR